MLVWETNNDGNHYALKSAGGSHRLYRNGVFHSQFHAGRVANGGVWDMLWTPVFALSGHKPRSVLMLGVGLGAALCKLKCFSPDLNIVAIDIDKTHLHLAKKLLREHGISQANIKFIHADAIEWLANYSGEPFDVIIDDLFIDHDKSGEVSASRVIGLLDCNIEGAPAKKNWISLLAQQLSRDGLIVANCEAHRLAAGAYEYWRRNRRNAWGVVQRVDHYENRVLMLGQGNFNKVDWIKCCEQRLQESAWLSNSGKSTGKVKQELKKLFVDTKTRIL